MLDLGGGVGVPSKGSGTGAGGKEGQQDQEVSFFGLEKILFFFSDDRYISFFFSARG